MNEVNRHYHYKHIIAWASGASIQRKVLVPDGNTIDIVNWIDDPNPSWSENQVYRIKPVYKTEEMKITLLYGQWYIERVDVGSGNCLVTYNSINEQITDISRVK